MTNPASSNSPQGYTIDGGERDKSRLDLQSEVLRPTTEELLLRAGLGRGDACLDVGSGSGHTALLMAERVGPEGKVDGIDGDAETVALASRDAADRGLTNVTYQVADVYEFDRGGYDFAHCRFVLSHLSDPAAAVARIVNCVRPGGVVALEDLDASGIFGFPDNDLYPRVAALYEAVVGRGGGDARLAQRLPLVAKQAGLRDVAWRYHQPVLADGPAKHIPAMLLTNMRAAITAHGLADDDTLDEMIAQADALAESPDTLLSMPRLAQVWGRRP